MTSANVIVLKGSGKHEEYKAAAALSPGMLLELNSAGKVAFHATASGPHLKLFAKEDTLQGRIRTTAYSTDEVVQVHVAETGDKLDLLLKDGQVIVIGDKLTSNADGKLKKYVAPVDVGTLPPSDFHIVGYAEEALSPSGADGFIAVRIA